MYVRREESIQDTSASRQRVTPRRCGLRSPAISSFSCSSSVAFHHHKYFGDVTQPRARSQSSPRAGATAQSRSRATLAAVSCKVRVFELAARGRARGAGLQRANRWPRTSARARYWLTSSAAMTSETGVRSAPILATKRRPTGFAGR